MTRQGMIPIAVALVFCAPIDDSEAGEFPGGYRSICPESWHVPRDFAGDAFRRLERAGERWRAAQSSEEALAIAAELDAIASDPLTSWSGRTTATHDAACIRLQIGEFARAAQTLDSVEETEYRSPPELVHHFLLRARIASSVADFEALLKWSKVGLEAVQAIGDDHTRSLARAELLSSLGFATMMTGGSGGHDMLEEAVQIARSSLDWRVLAKTQSSLSAHRFVSGDDIGMFELLHEAYENNKRAGYHHGVISDLINLGNMYERVGQFDLALDYLSEAKETARSGPHAAHDADIDGHIAVSRFFLGDDELAYEILRRAISQFEAAGDTWHVGGLRRHLGTMERERGNFDEAARLHLLSMEEMRTYEVSREEIRILLELVEDELALGNVERALDYSNRAVTLVKESEEISGPQVARTLLLRSRSLIAARQHDAALAHLEASGALLEPDSYPPIVVAVASALAETHLSIGQVDQALPHMRQALDAIDTTRNVLETYRLGPRWSATHSKLHARFVGVLVDQYVRSGESFWLDEVLARTEAHRFAKVRYEHFFASDPERNKSSSGFVTSTGLEISLAANRWAASPRDPDLRRRYYELLHEMESTPDYPAHGAVPKWPGLPAIRKALGVDTSVLYYIRDDDRLLLLTINSNEVDIAEIPDAGVLISDASAFAQGIRSNSRDALGSKSSVSKRLFGPEPGKLRRNLLIVTDGDLEHVPFSALDLPDEQGHWDWLIKRHRVTRVAGLSGIVSKPDSGPYAGELAIFADPEFSQLRADERWTGSLVTLAASLREAQDLAASASGIDVAVYLGSDATESAFLAPSTRATRVVHVATHGLYLDEHPELVGLAFAPGHGNDGLLSLAELRNQQFHSELIVLSACHSGSGQLFAGEGTMSMGKELIARGAAATVTALWQVSDAATARLMAHFYDHLLEGASPAVALARAKENMLATRRFQHPFYWAAFSLTAVRDMPPIWESRAATAQ